MNDEIILPSKISNSLSDKPHSTWEHNDLLDWCDLHNLV